LELSPHVSPDTEVVIGVETGGEAVRAVLRRDTFEIRRGRTPRADVTFSGQAELIGAVLSGLLTPDQAADLGLSIAGTPSVLTDLLDANRLSASARPAV
jgi:predicted NBD/HSP70 family sugar kinase